MDVKAGSGAFMATAEEARELAESIVGVANGAGVTTSALITDMNEPLCGSAGNALEVREAISFLKGEGQRARLHEVVMALAAELLQLGGLAANGEEAHELLETALSSGKAAERFSQMVSALGGPSDLLENPGQHLAEAPLISEVRAPKDGFVTSLATRDLGLAVVQLGGGRRRAEDDIDYAVGLSEIIPRGAKVSSGDVLCRIHSRDEDSARAAFQSVMAAISITESEPALTDPVLTTIR
jgi:thymidine phosphorylase